MKKMQVFPYICIILFPYFTLIGLICFAFLEADFMLATHLVISFAILITLCIWCNKSAVSGKSNMKSVVMNIVTKICYIPLCFIFLQYYYGIFSFLLMIIDPLPVIPAFTGLYNIGNCIRLYRNGKCSRGKSVILCIMGFVHRLDIIGAIIQCLIAGKPENKRSKLL